MGLFGHTLGAVQWKVLCEVFMSCCLLSWRKKNQWLAKTSVNKQTPNLGLCSVTCTLQCVCAVFSVPFRVQCYMYCLMGNLQCAVYIVVLWVPYMQCALYTVETE